LPEGNAVLVVDDSLTVRMDLSDALTASGFRVTAVGTLAAARGALARQPYFLLILDVQLPDGDGVEFLQELRARPDTSRMRVMLLSAEAEVRDRVRGLQTAADDYVGKPYALQYVIARATEFQPSANSSAASVLLIEDSETFRETVKAFLESLGYKVIAAAGGAFATERGGRGWDATGHERRRGDSPPEFGSGFALGAVRDADGRRGSGQRIGRARGRG
jgi:DNA-binding response OmpR family regulator